METENIKKFAPFGIVFLSGIFLFNFSSLTIFLVTLLVILFLFAFADSDLILFFMEKFGSDPKTLKGKVVWITGASTGLGEGVALYLAKLNCRLVLSSRTKSKLEEVKDKCLSCSNINSHDVLVLPFDMVDYTKHEEALSTVLKHFGKLDIFLSNAGRSQRAHWEMINVEVDKQLFELNVFSLISLSRLVTKHFLSVGRGHHVVTLSVASVIGVPMSGSYTGSKHALRGYFEALRLEKSGEGISVTLLSPGPVESNLMEGCFGESPDAKGFPERTGKLMPVERFSHLTSIAIANCLSEAWICHQPALLLMYLYQYLPSLFKWIVSKVNFSKFAMKIRDGRSGIQK